jgi:hypothetical protein
MSANTNGINTQQLGQDFIGTGAPLSAITNQKKSGAEPIFQNPYPAEGEPYPIGNRMPEYSPGTGQLYEPAQYQWNRQTDPLQYNPNSGSSYSGFSYSQPSYTPSPYLKEQVENITRGFNRNLSEQVLPQLRNRFIANGGLGGSRQGIAEGLATARSAEGLASAITNLYAQDYENSMNRALQGSIASMNSGLQARNMELQNEMNRLNSERNFYTAQRGQDLSQMALAAGLLGQANQGFLGQGQGIYGLGNIEQQAPWQQAQNYGGLLAPFQQAGATNAQSQQYYYNPAMQYIGANMQAAASLLPLLSDARLKENIRPVGETYDGLTTYTYNYKGDDTPQMGVMAQEVERKKPEALGPTVNGFKTVRYGLLGV